MFTLHVVLMHSLEHRSKSIKGHYTKKLIMRYVVGLPFSALSLILCSIPSSAATVVATQETTSVQVFADFLTETDIEWCQGAAAAAAGKEANYVYGGAPRRLHSPVVLDQDLYTRIYAAMLGDSDQVDAKQGDDSSGRALLDHVIEDTNLIVSTLTDTTDSHMDCYDDGMHVEGKTGFVFLSDEKDAYFVHGDVHVPVKQGALVTFQGSEEHYTVIPPGKTVQILGPFAMRDGRHLKFVVASPTSAAPSAGPTTIEDTCELCNLDFGGGKTFYTIKKEIFGICIEKCVPSVWINKFESIGFECGSCKN